MARLDIVKAKEVELQGKPQEVIASELEKIESPIAWQTLHNFDPVRYPKKMPDGFKAVGVNGGDMSYGFIITMPDKPGTFLKIEKNDVETKVVAKTSLESQLKLAEALESMGVPTIKPLRSGAGKEKPFSVTLPTNKLWPKQIRGCKVSHQLAISGTDNSNFLASAARTLGEFQNAGTKYISETKDHGIAKYDRNLSKNLTAIPGIIATFLEDVGFVGKDIKDIDTICKTEGADFNIIFKTLLDKNKAYIDSNKDSTAPTTKLYIEQITQLSEAATNGNLAKHIGVLAAVGDKLETLQNLPKGFAHYDSHKGNFMSGKDGVAVIFDFGETSASAPLAVDLLSLLWHPLKNEIGDERKEIVKAVLAGYDAGRGDELLPRLSQKEVESMCFLDPISSIQPISQHIQSVVQEVNGVGNAPPKTKDINVSITNEAEFITAVEDIPFSQWLTEAREEALQTNITMKPPLGPGQLHEVNLS